ncbi:AN1-type zinc finger protein (macronuclear) [Tetrahymena thermophila SB210]|uniref:AN1-type zinc finger protein n=1 Tax=Tetrahymena thermophila (strain SB210) TaxID=312017 RepID=I7MF56_TETTS|nr:AN1-type zinc finger protein [Tetrahymena thermophila SB210]EAR99365.2 AN1-type zinc finger protein [Tetrahymena thermophila SB210]|eukprot:XP_001019610.2 AN1-type zinc finger protein [Tetrahymena thermophila SB210]
MEFQNLGKVCSILHCKQKDFLPYKCSCCERTYCQDHFRQEAHDCNQSDRYAKKAIVCPFCLQTIKYNGSHTETEALDIHQATDCDQKNRDKILKEKEKIFCESGKKCKQALTDLNTFVCKLCDRQLCLKHRIPEEHVCQRIKRDPNQKKIVQVEQRLEQIRLDQQVKENPSVLGGAINQRREYNVNSYQQQTNQQYQNQANHSQQSQQDQLNQRRQMMQMRAQQQQQQQQSNLNQNQNQQSQQIQQQNIGYWNAIHSQNVQQQIQQPQVTQQQQQQLQTNQVNQRIQPSNYREPQREICNVCGRSFETIVELLSHAEQAHQPQQNNSGNQASQQQNTTTNNNNQNNSNLAKEVCDVCGKSFNGFEELIAHAEKTHFVETN